MTEFIVKIKTETPPTVGTILGGGLVTSVEMPSEEKITVSQLAKLMGYSAKTIRDRCSAINIGTDGKHVYIKEQAMKLLSKKEVKRGRKRAC